VFVERSTNGGRPPNWLGQKKTKKKKNKRPTSTDGGSPGNSWLGSTTTRKYGRANETLGTGKSLRKKQRFTADKKIGEKLKRKILARGHRTPASSLKGGEKQAFISNLKDLRGREGGGKIRGEGKGTSIK